MALTRRTTVHHGRFWERVAEGWLIAHGLRPALRNHRLGRDELDLVMHDRGTLVIIEVRYRRSASHGGALSSVSATKRHRIIRATQSLLMQRPAWRELPLRFDIVAIDGRQARLPAFHWVKNAFDASD